MQLERRQTRTALVAVDLPNGRDLGTAARPPADYRFLLLPAASIQALVDRQHKDIDYYYFERIDSDGRCALVDLLSGYMTSSSFRGIVTPIGQTALFERRGDHRELLTIIASWET